MNPGCITMDNVLLLWALMVFISVREYHLEHLFIKKPEKGSGLLLVLCLILNRLLSGKTGLYAYALSEIQLPSLDVQSPQANKGIHFLP